MRFSDLLKTATEQRREAALPLFDQTAFTLGFSSLGGQQTTSLDLEAAVVVAGILFSRRELRLSRFVAVLVQWLRRYHEHLNPGKLHRMMRAAEELGRERGVEFPVLRLCGHVLFRFDKKRFRLLEPEPLSTAFYLEPRLKALVDEDIAERGYYMGLSRSAGLMIPEGAFKERASDLLPERSYLQRNEQLRLRLLMGPTARADVAYHLKHRPEMSARRLAREAFLSYEPANRLRKDLARDETLAMLRSMEAAL